MTHNLLEAKNKDFTYYAQRIGNTNRYVITRHANSLNPRYSIGENGEVIEFATSVEGDTIRTRSFKSEKEAAEYIKKLAKEG